MTLAGGTQAKQLGGMVDQHESAFTAEVEWCVILMCELVFTTRRRSGETVIPNILNFLQFLRLLEFLHFHADRAMTH